MAANADHGALRPEDLRPMTPDEIAEVRAQRIIEPDDEEACRVPGAAAKGTCAYAGPDGKDACGVRCIWKGDALPPIAEAGPS